MRRDNQHLLIKLISALLSLCILVLPIACNESPSSDRRVIAVVPKGTTHIYWRSVEAGARQAGSDYDVDILWKGPLKENDRAQQVSLIEQLVTQGVDGIVLAPLDEKALLRPVKSAAQAGIPVVIFDSGLNGIPGTDFVSFVATNNYSAGELAGKRMAEILDNEGQVGVLRYQVGSGSTSKREEGFLESIKLFPKMKPVFENQYGGVTVGETIQKSEELLDVLEKTDGIFCPTEPTTYGLLVALKKHGLLGKIKIIGFDSSIDLLKALESGELEGLVLQDPRKMAYLAVESMVKHLNGDSVPVQIDTAVRIISSEDLKNPEVLALTGE